MSASLRTCRGVVLRTKKLGAVRLCSIAVKQHGTAAQTHPLNCFTTHITALNPHATFLCPSHPNAPSSRTSASVTVEQQRNSPSGQATGACIVLLRPWRCTGANPQYSRSKGSKGKLSAHFCNCPVLPLLPPLALPLLLPLMVLLVSPVVLPLAVTRPLRLALPLPPRVVALAHDVQQQRPAASPPLFPPCLPPAAPSVPQAAALAAARQPGAWPRFWWRHPGHGE